MTKKLLVLVSFTTLIFTIFIPSFALRSDAPHAYHFRTAADPSAERYVLNCHTQGAVVSGTKVSLWPATGDGSQEWFVDWTSFRETDPTAILRPNTNKTLALNANRTSVGTVCDVLPSNGNIYNDYNITLVGSHRYSPTEVKLRLPARYNQTSPVYVTQNGVRNYCTWNYAGNNQTWFMADGPSI